jgi:hypothetical protein
MKKITILTAVLFLVMTSYAQEKDNTLSPEEFANGWELLFDGESLKGWKAYNGEEPKGWIVKDGSLYCTGVDGGDDLMSIKHFKDFDLKFQWKIEEGGNSGVIYRTREGKQFKSPYHTGPEFQVMDDPGEFGNKSTGSFYDVVATTKNKKINPAMEWNSGRIRVSNKLVSHWVNGVLVMQCEMHSEEWKKAVAESKWKEREYYGMAPFGHIDFQNHGAVVWFKDVKIKTLD